MSETVYLKKWEREALYKKMIELNNELADKGLRGISKESELVHKILEMTIKKIEVSESGSLIIRT
ncbi:hypothetical protein WDM69_07960 [Moraxella lincolnii]|uniref:hypothetical protein n=1 Tax=Lwoffella lincolnii TaxID=90241 RepID=UPI002055EE17|nr:MAG TPA: hypothetical protein [Inoviridae sp.]